jgi:putative MATE family efflux protein
VFVQLSLGLNSFISCQGHARIAMLSVIIGAVSNIVLDPIFIFALDMGVKGAALATILSQALSALWILRFLASERSTIRLRRKYICWNKAVIGAIAALGVSPFIMQSTECIISLVFNTQLQRWGGDLYVGSMTVLHSVMQMTFVTVQGFTYGVQPILSYNYGSGNYSRVKACFRRMSAFAISGMVIISACTIVFPGFFARVFTNDEALIALVKQVLPVYMGAMGIFGIQTCVQCTFLALGKTKQSFFLACLRKIILLTPLAFLLPHITGSVMGVYWAEPVSDFISAVTAGFLFIPVYRNLDKKNPEDL